MSEIRKRSAVASVIILIALIAFVVPTSRQAVIAFFTLGEPDLAEGVYYTCPMHPDIRLPQRGECPICGMSLVEKMPGEEVESGMVSVTTQQIQLSGITVDPVKRRTLYREIDAYGKIDYDETRLGVVSAWVGGRIDRLFIDFTGVTINKGHALVELYSPDLISTQREYLVALENLEKVEGSGFEEAVRNAEELVKSSRQRLIWMGLGERQIEAIARGKTFTERITIYAPQGGTIIRKEAYPGMYVKEGDVLFHIADLSRVWLFADIYEDEIAYLYEERADDYYECTMHPEVTSKKPGVCSKCRMDLIRANRSLKVDIKTRAYPTETFEGYISFTDPFLNPNTRTVRVRVNVDNVGLKLKPDMFARAKIHVPIGEALAVPENAVIHSGARTIVLVAEGRGRFRPTLVKLGRRWLKDVEREMGDEESLQFQRESLRYHEVVEGLAPGDEIVTSGNFLLGSESQLQGALAKMLEEAGEGRETAAPMKDVPKLEEKSFPVIFDAYLGITGKLANDTLDGIPELAARITDKAVNPSIRKAADPLRHAVHKNDIGEVRQDYRRLSEVMIAYVAAHRSHVEPVPFKAYCPMAGPKGSYWLAAERTIANPYFGESMLRCGRIEAWDKPQ